MEIHLIEQEGPWEGYSSTIFQHATLILLKNDDTEKYYTPP